MSTNCPNTKFFSLCTELPREGTAETLLATRAVRVLPAKHGPRDPPGAPPGGAARASGDHLQRHLLLSRRRWLQRRRHWLLIYSLLVWHRLRRLWSSQGRGAEPTAAERRLRHAGNPPEPSPSAGRLPSWSWRHRCDQHVHQHLLVAERWGMR